MPQKFYNIQNILAYRKVKLSKDLHRISTANMLVANSSKENRYTSRIKKIKPVLKDIILFSLTDGS